MNKMQLCKEIFSETLLEIAKKDKSIMVLTMDARFSASINNFAENLPEQFVEVGIAEQNAIGVAAGLSKTGKKPFVFAPATFLSSRCIDQIKIDVIYSNSNVKLIGVSGGVSYGPLGYSHYSINDIAIMRTFPNMTVILPSDINQAKSIAKKLVEYNGPAYVRMGRNPIPEVYEKNIDFEIGVGYTLKDGEDVTIIGTGETTHKILQADEILNSFGVRARIIDMPTIKPLDKNLILKAAKEIGKIVVVEEHTIYGGLSSCIAEFLSQNYPIPILPISFPDEFPISGNSEEIFDYYGLSPEKIVKRVLDFLNTFTKDEL
ncbi:MAG TPA: transketolase C-terminal domain-containing protein [Dictyoglomaceae bacterium]|nr:transketolase C-terminal domain-containing protein [Dictyoglomaceae bacterium]HPU43779.1 transketolase C-terminal domain-containing protein [Dictyoglomaceae bacterium]